MFQKASQILQSAGESEGWSSGQILSDLGLLELDQGNFAEAERYARQALAMNRRLTGESSPDVAESLLEVGMIRELQGDATGAEPVFREALAIRRSELRSGHPDIVSAEVRLAEVLTDEGQSNSVEPLLADAEKSVHNSPFPLQSWQIAEVDSAMGAYLIKQGKASQGLALLHPTAAAMKDYPQAALKRSILQRTAAQERAVQSANLAAKRS